LPNLLYKPINQHHLSSVNALAAFNETHIDYKHRSLHSN